MIASRCQVLRSLILILILIPISEVGARENLFHHFQAREKQILRRRSHGHVARSGQKTWGRECTATTHHLLVMPNLGIHHIFSPSCIITFHFLPQVSLQILSAGLGGLRVEACFGLVT